MSHTYVMVSDLDDVLVNISIPWVGKVAGAKALATKSLLELMKTPERAVAGILSRRFPWIQQYLVAEHKLPEGLLRQVDALYRDSTDFYQGLPRTAYCNGVIQAAAMGVIRELHIVTHNYDNADPVVASKQRWIEENILSVLPDAQVHMVSGHAPKSEVINRVAPDAYAYADDSLKNVEDVLLNTKVREIAVPRMGHNEITAPLLVAAKVRGATLAHYTNVL